MSTSRVALALSLLTACGGDPAGDPVIVGPTGTPGPFFEEPMFFNVDVSGAPVAANSSQLIGALRTAGGWGHGDRMSIDFGFSILHKAADTQMRSFTPDTSFFMSPDCDMDQVPVPIPGNIEGESGYECTSNGDCHLIVVDDADHRVYEMWKANISSATQFKGGCLAVWDTQQVYDKTLRGDQCASADGAGFPIAPMLFTADEVASGEIDHAIRFVLPNDRITQGFVRPAVHAAYTEGGEDLPPYGVHLRLRADYPVDSLPSEGAKVIARALQKYGMYHADGGDYALTAVSDRYSTAKWAGVLKEDDLNELLVEDFEVVDHGPKIEITNDCMR
jgi:serine/threonine-protein kinase